MAYFSFFVRGSPFGTAKVSAQRIDEALGCLKLFEQLLNPFAILTEALKELLGVVLLHGRLCLQLLYPPLAHLMGCTGLREHWRANLSDRHSIPATQSLRPAWPHRPLFRAVRSQLAVPCTWQSTSCPAGRDKNQGPSISDVPLRSVVKHFSRAADRASTTGHVCAAWAMVESAGSSPQSSPVGIGSPRAPLESPSPSLEPR